MSGPRRSFDRGFRDGAVRIVKETGRPVAHVVRELGVNEGTLGNWVRQDAAEQVGGLTADERAEPPGDFGLAHARQCTLVCEVVRSQRHAAPMMSSSARSVPSRFASLWACRSLSSASTVCSKAEFTVSFIVAAPVISRACSSSASSMSMRRFVIGLSISILCS